jgi:hypothetical protein
VAAIALLTLLPAVTQRTLAAAVPPPSSRADGSADDTPLAVELDPWSW